MRRALIHGIVLVTVGLIVAAAMSVATWSIFPVSPIPALVAGLGVLWLLVHVGTIVGRWFGGPRRLSF